MAKKEKAEKTTIFGKLSTHPEFVIGIVGEDNFVCRDDRGYYLSKKDYIGSSVMDPYRNFGYKRELVSIEKTDILAVLGLTENDTYNGWNMTDEQWVEKVLLRVEN